MRACSSAEVYLLTQMTLKDTILKDIEVSYAVHCAG